MSGVASPVIAIVLAGGDGARYGGARPKQLALLAGEPIIHHALRRLDQAGVIDRMVIVANPGWSTQIRQAAKTAVRRTPWVIVEGGPDRNASVGNAVAILGRDSARVLVHDAVRPLVTEELIRAVAEALLEHRAVLPVIACVDPMLDVAGGQVGGFHSRAVIHRGQTPQGFHLADLWRAMAFCAAVGAKFDTLYELVRHWDPGLPIRAIPGEPNNLKITVPFDHMIASHLLLEAQPLRLGGAQAG